MLFSLAWRKRPQTVASPQIVASQQANFCQASYFWVQAETGPWVTASGQGGQIARLACQPDAPEKCRALLCIAATDRRFGLLLAPGIGQLTVAGATFAGSAIPLRIDHHPETGIVTFLHPLDGHRSLALHADANLAFGHFQAPQARGFRLHRIDPDQLTLAATLAATEIAAVMALPAAWQSIVAGLRQGTLRVGLAEALLCRLPPDTLQDLATQLLVDKTLPATLRPALPADPWLGPRLDALLAWRENPAGAANRVSLPANEAQDIPGAHKSTAHRAGLGLTLHALARRGVPPKRVACVVGSARNEGPYLLDWVAHHRAIGFDHVFIYANDNSDGSDALLGRLADAGEITWIKNELSADALPQFRAYAHALSILPAILDYRWTLIADLDEYFGVDGTRFDGVRDYLAWQDGMRADAVALPWLLHLAAPADIWRDAPCPTRFPLREETVNHHIKSIFRTNQFWCSNAHYPDPSFGLAFNFRAQDGEAHRYKSPEQSPALAENPRATHAWIAHYIFKSAPEALMKITRGKGDRVSSDRQAGFAEMMEPFITLTNNRPLVRDTRTERCASGMNAELTRLRALPGVATCEAEIKENYRRAMEDVCLQFLRAAPAAEEGAAGLAFRGILRAQRHKTLFAMAE